MTSRAINCAAVVPVFAHRETACYSASPRRIATPGPSGAVLALLAVHASMNLRTAPRGLSGATLTLLSALLMAGCASRSLNPPPVVERSADGRGATGTVVGAGTPLYTVRADDTLASIARRFNVTPADLAAWNNLGTDPRVRRDQVLRLSPPPAALAPADAGPVAITQPVGDERIEQRPLGPASTPLASEMPSMAPPTTPAAPPVNAPLKTGPLGAKRPFSDAALAELSKPDAGATVASVSPAVTTPTETPKTADDASAIAWAWPATGKLVATFSEGKSKGIDIAGKAGDAVVAAADGKVIFSGAGARGYGNFVVVRHSPELLSVYAYNKINLVKEGAAVTKGQRIAEMGNSDTDSVKLHFEIRKDSKPVDPARYLPGR